MKGWSTFTNGIPRHIDEVAQRYRAMGMWGDADLRSTLREVGATSPKNTAVVDGDVRLTFADLLTEIAEVREGLRALGVGKHDFVTVALPNWFEQVVVTLAAVDLGAVVAPVSVRLRGELEHILSYTECSVAIVPEEFHGFSHADLIAGMRSRLPGLAHVVLTRATGARPGFVTYEELRVETGPDAVHNDEIDPDDPWQVIFTSGTTGAPKGVLRTHNNTLHTVRDLINQQHYGYFKGDGHDVALAVLPISFVFAQYLCELGALLTGGTLVLTETSDPGEVMQTIEAERVTYMGIVPSLMPRFLDEEYRVHDISSLRCVSPAGEAVTRERKEQMVQVFRCDVRESYGLAEFTWPLGQLLDAPLEKKLSTTGTVSPGTEIRIVDDEGGDVPEGTIGELLIRGPTCFPGYLKNEEATVQVIDDLGWFRTGDLVFRDSDGFFSICGRKKDVIKRKGAQVIPQEIEDALTGHQDVAEAAVVGLPDAERGEIACACVVIRDGAEVDSDDLLAFLQDRLATYKLPERIEFFDSLPLSANGKVLKSELRTALMEPE